MNRVLTEFPRRHPLVLPAVAWVAGLLTGFGTRPSYDFRCLAVFVGFLPWLLAVFFRRQVGYNVRVTGWLMLVFCLGYWRAGGTLNSAIDPPVDDAEIRLIAVVAGDPEPAGNPWIGDPGFPGGRLARGGWNTAKPWRPGIPEVVWPGIAGVQRTMGIQECPSDR